MVHSSNQESQSLRPRVGVAAVVLQDGKILLSQRKSALGNGFWSVAGGHLEYGESIEACAIRELEEEAGIKALSYQLGPWANNHIDDKHYVTLFVFITEFEGVPHCKEPEKSGEWSWFDLNLIPKPLFPTVATLIEDLGLDFLKEISFERKIKNSF